MAYEENGTLSTDRISPTDETIEIDDWVEVELEGLELENGVVRLPEVVTAPDSLVDNFDVGPDGPYADTEDLSDYYAGALDSYAITTDWAADNNRSLEGGVANYDDLIISSPGDGLPSYPSRGDSWSFRTHFNGGEMRSQMYFFAPNGAPRTDGYRVQVFALDDTAAGLELRKWENGETDAENLLYRSNDPDGFQANDVPQNETLEVVVNTTTDTITVSMFDSNGNELATSGQVSDATFDSGSFAWGLIDEGGGTAYIDGAELEGDSGNENSADGVVATDAHQLLDTNHRPTAWHDSSVETTFFAITEFDDEADALRIKAREYDHATDSLSQITEIDQVTLDRHYLPAIAVDDDGYLYIVYDARGEFSVQRSTNPYDTSDWEDKGTIPNTRDYRQLAVIDNELFVISRDGSPSGGDLSVARSADGADSWDTSILIDGKSDNLGAYPYDLAVNSVDKEIDVYASLCDDGERFDSVVHVTYDIDNDTAIGSDGTDLGLNSTRADLSNANSVIEDSEPTQLGAPMERIDGDLHVAYMRGDPGTDMELCHGTLTNGAWDRTVVETDLADESSHWNGARLGLSESTPLRIYETIRMSRDIDKTLGYWEFDGTWGTRQVARQFDELPHGVHFPHLVRNGPADCKWMMSEVTDPNADAGEAGDARLFVFGDAFEGITIE